MSGRTPLAGTFPETHIQIHVTGVKSGLRKRMSISPSKLMVKTDIGCDGIVVSNFYRHRERRQPIESGVMDMPRKAPVHIPFL
jgi:hypothetical protein